MNSPIIVQPFGPPENYFPAQEGGGRIAGNSAAGTSTPMQSVSYDQVQIREPRERVMMNSFTPIQVANLAVVPSGLEYLTMIDQLLVNQKVEMLEAFTGWETNNKYVILNGRGEQIYYTQEDSDCCTRQCFGKMRPFEMTIQDNLQRPVIHMSRPLACMDCCYPCCLQSMEVYTPVGEPIGYIEQEWSMCVPKFRILNARHETVLRIEGPFIPSSCCGDVDFQVLSADGLVEVGKISKRWSGFVREAFTDADNFGIQFPIDLSVDIKAVLLAATFLIDFMYFEHGRNN